MAAELLAGELRLDLYRIELSQVVSKYIGETEKNLARVFDAAENSSATLFFDEADALFGRRSEVAESRKRYAEEIRYFLQRMETCAAPVILSAGTKSSLPAVCLRKIRVVVRFPPTGPELAS